MGLRSVALALAVATSMFACSPPRATTVADLPEPVVVGPKAERFELSAANTAVEAEVSAGATFTITFGKVTGSLELTVDEPTKSRVSIDVDMNSASSTPGVVAEIAMSADFLDAGAYPAASFVSRRIETVGDGAYEMVGELTLHGVTRGLRMPVELTVSDCAIDVVVAFSFDRHDFGIQTEGTLESLVADTVAVRFVLAIARPGRQRDAC